MLVSFLILNYKSAGLVRNLLLNIENLNLNFDYEILVGDNASNDNLKQFQEELFKNKQRIKFFYFKNNDGYGAGNNRLAKEAKGKYFCILNPDIIIQKREDLEELINYIENHENIAVLSPALMYANKKIQQSYFRYYKYLTPVFRRTFLGKTKIGQKDLARFTMKDVEINGPTDVEWLMGSFWLVPRKVFNELGGFDENYFLYFEDTDFCHRAHLADYKVIYYPRVKVIHLHARDSKSETFWKTIFNKLTWVHIFSALKYFKKFHKIKN